MDGPKIALHVAGVAVVGAAMWWLEAPWWAIGMVTAGLAAMAAGRIPPGPGDRWKDDAGSVSVRPRMVVVRGDDADLRRFLRGDAD